jgi:5-methyltetrahydrofolate--homocysteine methyltransferase
MLVAARAMKGALAIIEPLLADTDVKPIGKVVAGTVEGDLHDIGKNLVCTMLGGAGFEIHDLGADVKAQTFVDAVKEHDANIVAMSALLTTTMVNMKGTIDALAEAGLRDKITILVGGAPLSQAYAEEIGADGFAPDASRAARLATSIVEGVA